MENELSPDEQRTAQTLAYLQNALSETERADFEQALIESAELRDELSRSRALLDSLSAASTNAAVETVQRQIMDAIECGASDIHLTPYRNEIQALFRIDGVLQETGSFPRSQESALVDRWKVLADMNITERHLPQDGRFPVHYDGKEYNFRVNILPTLYGEKVTARILPQQGLLLGLDRLRLSPEPLDALKRLARRSSGAVLTSGQTGSGKTTLLYSLLQEVRDSGRAGRNLMTVEDPVEYGFDLGISQTAVNVRAGLTFGVVLKSMLRADPDAILCGQIRDLQTAEVLTETAITGHLIFSALHTASALDIVSRLRAIGVENFLIADMLIGLIGQRLVRRIDERAVEEYQPDEDELKRLGLTRKDGPFVRGIPSEANNQTGFRGRLPLIEVIEVTQPLRQLIAKRASPEELARAAFGSGVPSLLDDARARVKAGLTTVEEANWALFEYPRY